MQTEKKIVGHSENRAITFTHSESKNTLIVDMNSRRGFGS